MSEVATEVLSEIKNRVMYVVYSLYIIDKPHCLCFFGIVLRRVCLAHTRFGQCLYVCLCLVWRVSCLDYWLGFVDGIRHW